MNYALLTSAIILVVLGHYFKIKRWGLYISIYETPSFRSLLSSLSIGHLINTFIPFRIGDVCRVALAGRTLKNGYTFALSTVIADLYVDLLTVGFMFFCLVALDKGGIELQKIAFFYVVIYLLVIPLTVLCVYARFYVKKMISFVSAFFNDDINFRILYLSYLSISALKDILFKISKVKFFVYSICIWTFYISAYFIFAEFLQSNEKQYTTSDVFAVLFSNFKYSVLQNEEFVYWGVFLVTPLLICLLISLLFLKPKLGKTTSVLPQLNKNDRFAFLKMYFSDENRDYIEPYLEINKDVNVLQDNSAGSNASTVVVLKKGDVFYRKYAFNEDGKKLNEQIDWIENHQKCIPLPVISDKLIKKKFTSYDMPCYTNAVGFFRYIHTMPIDESWRILKESLDNLSNAVHKINIRKSTADTIKKYIDNKVVKNLELIMSNSYIQKLESYESILVNGVQLDTLHKYSDILEKSHLQKIFSNDDYSDIHGDLTIENIVCLLNNKELNENDFEGKYIPKDYYFIDPNTGNVHDSSFLDFAKILQSLHGCYEFLTMVSDLTISQNSVTYFLSISENYRKLYHKYRDYLKNLFSKEQVISIYYHEIVHWLRLMPYKIRKNEKKAVIFYTGLLTVLRDIRDMKYE